MAEKIQLRLHESTRKMLEEELGEDFDGLSEAEIIEKAKASKKVMIVFKENNKVTIKQVLNG